MSDVGGKVMTWICNIVRSRRLPITAAFACIAIVPAHAGSAIKNGSFETPVVNDGGYQAIGAGDQFKGWTVIGTGTVALVNGHYQVSGLTFPAAKGEQWLDLTGDTNSDAGVQQQIATTAGKAYTLTFYVGNIYDPNGVFGTTSTVTLLIDDEPVASFTNKAGKDKRTQVWKKFSTEFIAQKTKTTIAFVNSDPPNDADNGLDGVTVVKSQ